MAVLGARAVGRTRRGRGRGHDPVPTRYAGRRVVEYLGYGSREGFRGSRGGEHVSVGIVPRRRGWPTRDAHGRVHAVAGVVRCKREPGKPRSEPKAVRALANANRGSAAGVGAREPGRVSVRGAVGGCEAPVRRVSRRPVRRRDGRAGCDVRVRDRGGHESHTRACAGARTSGRVRQFRGVGAGHRGIRGVRAGENGGRVWVEGRERERFWNRGAGFNSARQRHGRYTGRVHRVRVSVGAGVGVRFGVGGGSCGDERGTSGQRRGRRGRRDDGDDDEARRGERGVERGHEHERRGQKTTSGGIGIGTQLAKTNSSRRLARAFR
mmetsp:Transcript_5562/g.21025  ORF Transcript_5562/g.21025 Transcript_5562/m.21025 type:complete len:323 (-) Transcript_5562:769-1737(-)